MRDSQQALVYNAENEVEFMLTNGGVTDFYGSTLVIPEERKFGSIESAAAYVGRVCSWEPVRNTWDGAQSPPRVRARRGNTKAHYCAGVIALPPHGGGLSWAMRESVLLHELAHHFTTGDGHGPRFCGCLVDLFNKCIGPEAGLLLRAALDNRGASVQMPSSLV